MANPTKCLTPGAIFTTRISPDRVTVSVRLPNEELRILTEEEAIILETLIHNQMELALRPYFNTQNKMIDPNTDKPYEIGVGW